MIRASIVGASGYAGGEVLRLLLGHPEVAVSQITSESQVGQFAYHAHPNLRKRTALKFTSLAALEPCDLLFLALPHGQAQKQIERFAALAPKIVDLSADFRLRDPERYARWYGAPHAAPDWLPRFVYGLPELGRAAMAGADYISGVGCNAAAAILALLPLAKAGLIAADRPIVLDIKVGSSEGGNTPSLASHHPERSGAARTYSPAGHRHIAEVQQALDLVMGSSGSPCKVQMTVTTIEMVRGALAAAHVPIAAPVTDKDLWRAYRAAYADEPFVRLVRERAGVYRYPEPKLLAGTNYADVGFEADPDGERVVALCAIDNLMKGAAGSAVQAMNLMCGFPETMGLEFMGLHPV